jgi:hypothetical protein
MSKPSQVIVLVEDNRQQQIIRRYLRRIGLESHAMRFRLPRSGSGEQWVREQFSAEVAAYRQRNASARTTLIIIIDADTSTLRGRLAQLDGKLQEAGIEPIREREQIARLIPRRNIETWILCLNAIEVDEEIDYKRTRNDWSEHIRTAAEALYDWSRPNAQVPDACVPSLQAGLSELHRLDYHR